MGRVFIFSCFVSHGHSNTGVSWLILHLQSASDSDFLSMKTHCKGEKSSNGLKLRPDLLVTTVFSYRFMSLSTNT